MKRLALALALLPTLAAAQPAQKPEIVLLPRALAEAAAQWIARPDAGNAVQLYAALTACIADNPTGGVVRHTGPDQCPVVTQALAAKGKPDAPIPPTAAPPHPAAAGQGSRPRRGRRTPDPAPGSRDPAK